jgi:hypothetical protein
VKNLTNLFTLAVGICGNMFFFDPPRPLDRNASTTSKRKNSDESQERENMRNLMLGAALAGAFSVAVAGPSQTELQHKMGRMMQMNCPMQVQGAQVAVTDSANGVVVTITTESGNVDELRRRVEHIAAMPNANEDRTAMMPNGMIAATVNTNRFQTAQS